jgi:diguanylate cyclase (GGDEF)-like protein/PAS domain S-box-containing protein
VNDGSWPKLSGLSTDWYWEQDAELRFARVDVQIGTPGEQALARKILGKKRWETGIEVEGGWDAHRALLQARAPFRDVLMWRDFDDGTRRYVSVSGEPVFDANGQFSGYRGVGRDVTEQKRSELLLRMQHTVTRRLAEANAAAEGIAGALRAVCETEGWDCAEFWRLDPAAGEMRRFARWASPGFAECPDEGLIDAVRRSGEPLWVPDCSQDPRALRKRLPEESGVRAALLCPVSTAGRVVGVLAFTCRRIRPPDDPLLEALLALASQMGLFLERTDSEARLRESEERYRRTFELAASGIAHIGLDRRFVRVNRRICEILGYPQAELLGRTGREISHPEDLDVINALRPRLYAGEVHTVRTDKRYRRKDGSTVWVTLTLALERDASGKPLYEIAVYDDITARKATEAALRESEERFRSLTEMSSDFFWETDGAHRTVTLVHGPSYAGKLDPGEAGWAAMRTLMDTHAAFGDFEFGGPSRDGTARYFSVSGEPRFGPDGGFLGYRGVGHDITEIVLARERITSLAYQDALTGLANRASLAPALQQAVERTKRRGSKLAGLFIDLDGFKQVNDAHGHDAGDRLLAEAARRLRASLRSGDPVARLGGDEFFAVLEDMHDAHSIERVAQKLLAAIREPYDIGGARQAVVSASIGISVFPGDAADADTLMKHADTAMYGAKEAGKNAYRFFGAFVGGAGR